MKDIIKIKALSLYLKKPTVFPVPLWQINYLIDQNEADLEVDNEQITSLLIEKNQSLLYYWNNQDTIDNDLLNDKTRVLLNASYINSSIIELFETKEVFYRFAFNTDEITQLNNKFHMDLELRTIHLENDYSLIEHFVSSLSSSNLSMNQLDFLQLRAVYEANFWFGLIDTNGKLVGLAIGEFDRKIKEGIISYVEVLPTHSAYKPMLTQQLMLKLCESSELITVNVEEDDVSIYSSFNYNAKTKWLRLTR